MRLTTEKKIKMSNLTKHKKTKYLEQTMPHSYTQKLWIMFYCRLDNNKKSQLIYKMGNGQ